MKTRWFVFAIFVGGILDMNAARSISIISPAFESGGDIPAKFTCNGANGSPPLQIKGVRNETKSLVLIVDDPDAPSGLFTHWIAWNIDPKTTEIDAPSGLFTHWIAWNIDPKTTEIAENSAPASAIQGMNDFGKRNYGGPCPPSGTHRYFFKIFALDTKLELKPNARRAELDSAIHGHVLAQGELMARYSHK